MLCGESLIAESRVSVPLQYSPTSNNDGGEGKLNEAGHDLHG